MLDTTGRVVKAGWTVGVHETLQWLELNSPKDSLLFVDAPLVVNNCTGQRLCETQVGQRYGRWKVSANSTNLKKAELAGKILLEQLLPQGWKYHDGVCGPPIGSGRFVSECYPYTTIVGTHELGYEYERPIYKRKPKRMNSSVFRTIRRINCDILIRRIGKLKNADPPLDLLTHADTRQLKSYKSPIVDKHYKHREDLLDATICAWTAAFWYRWGLARCQVLGKNDVSINGFRSTIIAPARLEQRC